MAKLIDLYKEWMETGAMGTPLAYGGGFCNLLPEKYHNSLNLVRADSLERIALGKEGLCHVFWASGLHKNSHYQKLAYSMTPLRETLILIICAMHDEL